MGNLKTLNGRLGNRDSIFSHQPVLPAGPRVVFFMPLPHTYCFSPSNTPVVLSWKAANLLKGWLKKQLRSATFNILLGNDCMHLLRIFKKCFFSLLLVLESGCHGNGVSVRFHQRCGIIPSKLHLFRCTASKQQPEKFPPEPLSSNSAFKHTPIPSVLWHLN